MDFQGDLTQGSIFKKMLSFAVPFMLANFVQALYGTVDMAMVGWWGSTAAISAVSTGSQVMQMLTSLVSGLTMGGTILIGQFFGARRDDDTRRTISSMLTMFGIAAVLFTALMLAVSHPLLKLLQTPAEAFAQAYQYVMICSCGILFIFAYNALSAMLRGLGDSKSPLVFIAVACGVNIVLDAVFVGGLRLGAAGAAAATVLSQAVSVVLAVIFLSRHNFIFDFRLKSFRLYRDKAVKIIRLGLPVSLQETMVTVSFLIIAAIVNSLGVVPSAACGIVGKFEGFAMLPATALGSALASMAAQNMGAGQTERARKALHIGIGFSLACAMVFFLWSQLSPESVMRIFKADDAVTAAGAQYLRSFSIDYLMVAFVFCYNGFFNGCGSTTFSMVNGLVSTILVRVPLAFLFSRIMPESLFGLGLAAPIASFLSIILGFIYLRTDRWQKNRLVE